MCGFSSCVQLFVRIPYRDKNIESKIDDFCEDWFGDEYKKKDKRVKEIAIKEFIASADDVSKILFQKIPYTATSDLSKKIYNSTIAYIKVKLLKIISKYNEFKNLHNDLISLHLENDSIKMVLNKGKSEFNKFFDEILISKSHISKKIRRSINSLNMSYENATDIKQNGKYQKTLKATDIDRYLKKQEDEISPELVEDYLPSPIFEYKLLLDKIENKDIIKEKINYKNLSSGEIQLLQTISIHTYHIMNLLSVNKDRPRYNNINLVFDELEICFHPEYQRQFVKKMLTVIENMGINKKVSINIFLITHSPFVLSDIPRSNILYMETEEDKAKGKKLPTHSFAQNIGDMMYDSFFMEKTIGDFAEEKLKELIRKKQGKKTLMSSEEAEAVLNAIGDPVIRSLIDEIEANDD